MDVVPSGAVIGGSPPSTSPLIAPPVGPTTTSQPMYGRSTRDVPPATLTTVTRRVPTSALAFTFALVGVGLFLNGLGYTLARSGHESPALPLFFTGLVTIFVPCAWRLTGRSATRQERIGTSLILGLGLVASYYLRSPLIFDWFDELLHGATVNGLLDSRTLLIHNSILPVSPYYPGLELVTTSVKWATGLPLVLAELVVVLATRIVLVLGVFLVVEKVCGSHRAGGIAVLIFTCSPTFYTFASWNYGCVALVLAVAVVYFLLSATDGREQSTASAGGEPGTAGNDQRRLLVLTRGRRDLLLALGTIATMVVTHHLTAWLLAGVLVVWTFGLWLRGRRGQARRIGIAALTNLVLVAGWSAFVGSHLTSYLNPLFSEAESGFTSALLRLHGNRQLFHTSANQGGSSLWEIVVMLAAAALWCLLLCPSVLAVVRNRTGGRFNFWWVPAIVAAGYPLAMFASVSSGSAQVGVRATTFIFFGLAITVGGWWARRDPRRRRLEGSAALLIASVCFLGGMIFGSGPDVTYVPGPYLVGANQRSVSSPSLAAAEWAASNLPAGSNVVADRQLGALMADIGHVNLVTTIGGFSNPSPLLFDSEFGPNDVSLIKREQNQLRRNRPTTGIIPASLRHLPRGWRSETRYPSRLG